MNHRQKLAQGRPNLHLVFLPLCLILVLILSERTSAQLDCRQVDENRVDVYEAGLFIGHIEVIGNSTGHFCGPNGDIFAKYSVESGRIYIYDLNGEHMMLGSDIVYLFSVVSKALGGNQNNSNVQSVPIGVLPRALTTNCLTVGKCGLTVYKSVLCRTRDNYHMVDILYK